MTTRWSCRTNILPSQVHSTSCHQHTIRHEARHRRMFLWSCSLSVIDHTMLQKHSGSVFTVRQYNIKNGACFVHNEMSFPYERKYQAQNKNNQTTSLRPSPQPIDVFVYSSSSLDKQGSNGDERCTAVLLDHCNSTVPNSLHSFHLPIHSMYTSFR